MKKLLLILTVSIIPSIATACTEAEAPFAEPPQVVEAGIIEEPQIMLYEEHEEVKQDVEEMQHEEIPAEPPAFTDMPYVSDFGRQVTEDFLVQFLSIFSFGWRWIEGQEYFDIRRGIIQDAPLVWTIGGFPYFDNRGNIIEDAPFILGDSMIAFDFELFDLDYSGIPDILVRFVIPETCAAARVLYRFVDGKFVPSIPLDYFVFFRNEQGRIVTLFNCVLGGHTMFGYYYMDFDGPEMIFEPIVIEVYDHSTWWDFHRSRQRPDGTHILDIDTIFGTDIPITHIARLEQLETEITASIMERLGLEQ